MKEILDLLCNPVSVLHVSDAIVQSQYSRFLENAVARTTKVLPGIHNVREFGVHKQLVHIIRTQCCLGFQSCR